MNKFDYLIVGAGYAGATLARKLTDYGRKVLVIDKRDHIAGNAYDRYDEAGVLIHQYGPHYFRTNHKDVKRFLSRFTDWIPQSYKVRVSIENKLYSFPINRTTLNQFFGVNLKTKKQARDFLAEKAADIPEPQNAEEQVLSLAGKEIYEAFFKGYTEKQWGMSAKELGPSVTARIPIRLDTNDEYTSAEFQALPTHGYTAMFKNMLAGIPLILNLDFKEAKKYFKYDKLIYTGPIDTYFDHCYGKLPYRSLRFQFETYEKDFYQDWLQINYPNEYDYTRIVEVKHITKQKTPFTTISREFPMSKGDPYYPIPNPKNQEAYLMYKKRANRLKNVFFIGRLAEYRYINMDQVTKSALDLSKKLKYLV